MNLRSLRIAVSLTMVVAAGAARAEPSDADRATARAMALEGYDAMGRKDFRLAEERFARADALVHAPTLMLGLARAQLALGKLVEAHESYQRILREGVKAGSPAPFFRAYRAAAKEVEPAAARVPWVTVSVTGASKAEITIDDAPVPQAALGFRRPINPGDHRVRASAAGFRPAERTFTIGERERLAVALELRALPDPGTQPSATHSPATSHSSARGGGPSDVDLPTAPAPSAMWSTSIPSGAGEASAGSRSSGLRRVGYVALGLGAAGLATGAITGVLAFRQHAELVEACPHRTCGPEQQSTMDSYHRFSTVSSVSLIAGGAATVTGLVLLLTTTPDKPRGSVGTLYPEAGFGLVGAGATF